MKIGYFQTNPIFGEKKRNVQRALDGLRGVDADVIVLPELFSTGYLFLLPEEVANAAEEIPNGWTVRTMSEFCKETGMSVIFGMVERSGDRLYNSSVFLSPEGLIGTYRKIHLFNREKELFKQGDTGFSVFKRGETSFGIMLCFDWAFPESARTLSLKGADIICHPSNLVLPYAPEAMITRAIENGVFIVLSNRTGEDRRGDESLKFTGRSRIISPKGELLASSPAESEEVQVVEVNPEAAREKMLTPRNHLFKDRRPDLYQS